MLATEVLLEEVLALEVLAVGAAEAHPLDAVGGHHDEVLTLLIDMGTGSCEGFGSG